MRRMEFVRRPSMNLVQNFRNLQPTAGLDGLRVYALGNRQVYVWYRTQAAVRSDVPVPQQELRRPRRSTTSTSGSRANRCPRWNRRDEAMTSSTRTSRRVAEPVPDT